MIFYLLIQLTTVATGNRWKNKVGFQIDTSKMALSANQIEAERVSTNQRDNLPGSQITLITCKLSVQVSNGGRILLSH